MVSFYKYFQREISNLKELLISKIDGIIKSIDVALVELKERLKGMNEFRDTLKDQASMFVTREEMSSRIAGLEKQVDELRISKAQLEGKADQNSVNRALMIALVGILFGLIGTVLAIYNSFRIK